MKALITLILAIIAAGCSRAIPSLSRAQVIEKERALDGSIIKIEGEDTAGPFPDLPARFEIPRGETRGELHISTRKQKITLKWPAKADRYYQASAYQTKEGELLIVLREIE